MARELYLYSGIYSFTAQMLIAEMEKSADEDIVIRVNSPGGDVFSGWGIASKIQEHKGNVTIKVDGMAASMAAVMLPFADFVEVLDVTKIMIHKAIGSVENDAEKLLLAQVNESLKKKLKGKIDAAKLKELKGVSIDTLFAEGERMDLWLTAQEAKQIGLVDKVNKLSAAEAQYFQNIFQVAASMEGHAPKITESKSDTMDKITLKELQEKFPAVYAEAVKVGADAEADRMGAWLAFIDIDSKAVHEGIKSGKAISQTQSAEFAKKMFSASAEKSLTDESAVVIEGAATGAVKADTKKTEMTADEKAFAEFEAKVRAEAGLKTA